MNVGPINEKKGEKVKNQNPAKLALDEYRTLSPKSQYHESAN